MNTYSTCCGTGVDVDKLTCLDCKEHCGVEYECEECHSLSEELELRSDNKNVCKGCYTETMDSQL